MHACGDPAKKGDTMLIIRREQFEAFSAAARRHLCDRLCELLMQVLPDHTANFEPADLVAFVETGMSRAMAWGFTWDSTIGDYVALCLQIGADFDREPAVQQVFKDNTIPVEQRVAVLFQRLTPAEWQAVAKRAEQ
jgi:hypothetical protein